MSTNLEQAYKTQLHNALEEFQFIEELLRVCITKAAEISKLQLAPYFPIQFAPKDIDNRSLGQLVNIFSKINADSALHEALRAITKERNHVAHRSFLLTLGEWGDEAGMTEATKKMKDLAGRAKALRYKLLDVRVELHKSLRKAQHANRSQDQEQADTSK